MTPSGALTRSDGGFVDALAGADGTADAPSLLWRRELFADALAEPEADALPMTPMVAPGPAAAGSAAPPSSGRGVARTPQKRPKGQRPADQGPPTAASYVVPAPAVTAAAPSAYAQLPAASVTPQYAASAYARPQDQTPQYATTHYPVPQYRTAQPSRPGRRSSTVPGTVAKKKSGAGGFLAFLIFVIIALFATGIGREIIDGISSLISQWTR